MALEQGPQAYGLPTTIWSIRDLQALLQRERGVAGVYGLALHVHDGSGRVRAADGAALRSLMIYLGYPDVCALPWPAGALSTEREGVWEMQNEPELSWQSEHHYPPTTAEWVTSPLMREDEVEPNPLEPTARPPVKPGLRLAALLIIGSGLLSLCGLIVEFYSANAASPSAWQSVTVFVFGFLTLFVPMVFAVCGVVRGIILSRSTSYRNISQVTQFAIGGVVFQLVHFVPLVIQLIVGHGLIPGTLPSPAYWIALVGFLMMLAVAQLVTRIARPPITEQDAYDDARYQKLRDMSLSGGNGSRVKVPAMPPPIPHR
jgi:hypothetical protein